MKQAILENFLLYKKRMVFSERCDDCVVAMLPSIIFDWRKGGRFQTLYVMSKINCLDSQSRPRSQDEISLSSLDPFKKKFVVEFVLKNIVCVFLTSTSLEFSKYLGERDI